MTLSQKITERLQAAIEMRNNHAAMRAETVNKNEAAYNYHNMEYQKWSAVISELAELAR